MINTRNVYGVGVNDSDTPVQLKGEDGSVIWRCPFYTKWANMLKRCYSKAALSKRPHYDNVTVCDEWLVFSNFKAWMKRQDYTNKCLDKDLIGDGSEYSPSSCVFIDDNVNSFIKTSVNKYGLPTGVSENGYGSFTATLSHKNNKKFLGTFKSVQEATFKYFEAKRLAAKENLADRPQWVLEAVLRRFDESRAMRLLHSRIMQIEP